MLKNLKTTDLVTPVKPELRGGNERLLVHEEKEQLQFPITETGNCRIAERGYCEWKNSLGRFDRWRPRLVFR